MRAIRVERFGDPSVLRVEEVPEAATGDGEVLIRTIATSINPVDQGAVSLRVDSTFGIHDIRAAHERFRQRGLNGKVTVTF